MNSTDMTSQEVDDFVDSLNITTIRAVDYVVEQGTNGSWTYRKWDSGFVECFAILNNSSLSWLSYMTWGYYANWTITYPFTIYNAIINASTRNVGSNVGWIANANPYSDSGFTATIVRNGDTGEVDINVYIVGRWKQ
jgi:hypothetical protein